MYQAEVSTPESRGFMVSMHGVMFAMGYTLSAWIGFGVYFITASGSTSSFPWRFPIAFQMVPALLLLLGSPWLPFSPRWLMMQDRAEEAHEVLKRLHRTKGDPHDTLARKEFYQMKKQVEMDRQIRSTTSNFELFKTAPNRRRALVGFLLMWNNQFTGVLIVSPHTPPQTTPTSLHLLTQTPDRQLRHHPLHLPRHDRLHSPPPHLPLGHINLPRQHLLRLLR